ncbi:MAG: BTAD domain-containing putative transcriptional regulator [Actinomycetota bacterium]
MVTSVTIRVLGPLEVEIDGAAIVLRRMEARLLLALVWQPGHWVDHQALSDRMYFDGEPRDTTSWRNHLRRSLGPASAIVETRRGRGTRLNCGPDGVALEIDVTDFQALRRRADEHQRAGSYAEALVDYRRALELWRAGTPYAELADDVNATARLASLREERRICEQAIARLSIDAGDYGSALPHLRSMVEEQPTDQATIAQLMRVSAAIGNPTLAGEYYDRLCRLLRERGEVPRAELVDLHGRILRDEFATTASPLRARPVRTPPLPRDLTRLIGRSDDLDRVHRSLEEAQLVTIAGPPGVGKSRLSREMARSRWPADALLVQLGSCPDGSATAVGHHLADELGLEHRSGTALISDLAHRLKAPNTLLVLDNCEHVIESLIVILASVFAHLDDLRVLATSREPLAIPGERVHRLEPLPVLIDGSPGLAVQLCHERILAAGGDDHGQAELVELCEQLDGLPLAIELAAPMVAIEGVEATVRRFGSRAESGTAIAAGRGRPSILSAAIRGSFERLDTLEQEVLFAVTTFSGSATAADVADVIDHPAAVVDDALVTLRTRSLLRAGAEPASYVPFETVRRFARLEAHHRGSADGFRAHHAARICALAGERDTLTQPLLVEAASALKWAMEAPSDEGVAIVDGLRHELYRIELPPAFGEWLLSLSHSDTRTGTIATELWANVAFFAGDYSGLHDRAQETLERVAGLGEPDRVVRAQVVVAFAFALAGDYEAAASHTQTAERLAAESSDRWAYAWAASIDAHRLRRDRRHAEAVERAVEALDRFEGLQYPQGMAFPFYTLGMAEYRSEGDVGRALDLLTLGIRHAEAGSDRMLQGVGELYAGQVHAEEGSVDAAVEALVRALWCCLDAPQWTLIVSALEYAAVILSLRDDKENALALTRFAASARWRHELPMRSRAIPYLSPAVAAPLEALPARPDPTHWTGASMSDTIALAISSLS